MNAVDHLPGGKINGYVTTWLDRQLYCPMWGESPVFNEIKKRKKVNSF